MEIFEIVKYGPYGTFEEAIMIKDENINGTLLITENGISIKDVVHYDLASPVDDLTKAIINLNGNRICCDKNLQKILKGYITTGV